MWTVLSVTRSADAERERELERKLRKDESSKSKSSEAANDPKASTQSELNKESKKEEETLTKARPEDDDTTGDKKRKSGGQQSPPQPQNPQTTTTPNVVREIFGATHTANLQFGRFSANVFTLDVAYPFSPLQAFGLALSALHTKLGVD